MATSPPRGSRVCFKCIAARARNHGVRVAGGASGIRAQIRCANDWSSVHEIILLSFDASDETTGKCIAAPASRPSAKAGAAARSVVASVRRGVSSPPRSATTADSGCCICSARARNAWHRVCAHSSTASYASCSSEAALVLSAVVWGSPAAGRAPLDDDAVSDTEVAASVSSVLWPSKHGWISNKKLNAGTCVCGRVRETKFRHASREVL